MSTHLNCDWCFRLQDNLQRLNQLEEEKSSISEHAQELQSTIQVCPLSSIIRTFFSDTPYPTPPTLLRKQPLIFGVESIYVEKPRVSTLVTDF